MSEDEFLKTSVRKGRELITKFKHEQLKRDLELYTIINNAFAGTDPTTLRHFNDLYNPKIEWEPPQRAEIKPVDEDEIEERKKQLQIILEE
jgi:hypothetical protein